MKRMNEVFELPVFESFDWVCGSSKAIAGEFNNHSQAKHAAHAINNVDALADALEEALLQIEYLHRKFGKTGSGNCVLSRGDAALNSYRGAK